MIEKKIGIETVYIVWEKMTLKITSGSVYLDLRFLAGYKPERAKVIAGRYMMRYYRQRSTTGNY